MYRCDRGTGIYCVHRLVGYVYTYLFERLGYDPALSLMSILIYITSYMISAAMAKFPLKICKRLVE